MFEHSDNNAVVPPTGTSKSEEAAKNKIALLQATWENHMLKEKIEELKGKISEMDGVIDELKDEKVVLCTALLMYNKIPFSKHFINQEVFTQVNTILTTYKEIK
jgi:hypothetical protein